MMVVKIAKNTWEFSVKFPMVRCALGNNFDKLSLSNIRYSMQQACTKDLDCSSSESEKHYALGATSITP